MRPTLPLLLITVLQGVAGGTALAVAILYLLAPPGGYFVFWDAEVAALVIASVGGIASFFHMHQISAGKYILRRLKTSWLSREALTTGLFAAGLGITVVAPLVFGPAPGFLLVMAWIDAALGLIAMYVTAMLYATIPAMRSWYSPLTVVGMMGIGILSGWELPTALLALTGAPGLLVRTSAALIVAMVAMLALVKALQRRFFYEARQSVNASTGTGMPMGPFRLQDTGTTRPPYRTQTQIWPDLPEGTRSAIYATMAGVLLGVPLVAAVALIAAPGDSLMAVIGLVAAVAGAFIERWIFFADATHSSKVWFGDQLKRRSRVASARRNPAFVERFRHQ